MSTTALKGTIRRKLEMHDGTKKRRPFFVEIEAEGVVRVWPRRCEPVEISIKGIYEYGVSLAADRAKDAKRKASGKPYLAKRGVLR